MDKKRDAQLNLFEFDLSPSRYSYVALIVIIITGGMLYLIRSKNPLTTSVQQQSSVLNETAITPPEAELQAASPKIEEGKPQIFIKKAPSAVLPEQQIIPKPEAPKPKSRPITQAVSSEDCWLGTYSPFITQKFSIIRSRSEWTNTCMQINIGKAVTEKFPHVDFNKNLIISLFLGQQNTGGYSISLTRLEYLEDKVIAYYKITAPSPETFTTKTLTQPYYLKIIPYTELPFTFIEEK